jgi:hypothetical protein
MRIEVKLVGEVDIYESVEDIEFDYSIKNELLRIYMKSPDSKGIFRTVGIYKNYDKCIIKY